MFCGTKSFSETDVGEPSPKGAKLKQSYSMNNNKKQSRSQNPFSATGRDKFEKTLAELEAQKEKIKSRVKIAQEDAIVRFTYRPGSKDWIPIIIKLKEEPPKEEEKKKKQKKRLSAPPSFSVERRAGVVRKTNKEEEVVKKNMLIKRPYSECCNWGMAIVAILVLLLFGKSFAICWTTMLWYLVPMVKEKRREHLKGRELGRRSSDKRLGGLQSPKVLQVNAKR